MSMINLIAIGLITSVVGGFVAKIYIESYLKYVTVMSEVVESIYVYMCYFCNPIPRNKTNQELIDRYLKYSEDIRLLSSKVSSINFYITKMPLMRVIFLIPSKDDFKTIAGNINFLSHRCINGDGVENDNHAKEIFEILGIDAKPFRRIRKCIDLFKKKCLRKK